MTVTWFRKDSSCNGEYSRDALSVFIAGSLSNITYWRKDHFYYSKGEAKSDKENFLGETVKGGANYNLTDHHNVFANIGYFPGLLTARRRVFTTGREQRDESGCSE